MSLFKVGSVDVKMRGVISRQGPPALPKTIELPKGHQKRPECRALPSTIILDQDQIFTLRDGTKIRADVFRPKSEDKFPAIVIWGPYGKSGSGLLNLHTMPFRAGVPEGQLSGYEDFEGLDPAEWVPKGFVLINVDPRGVNDSEGDVRWWGTAEGRDGYDVIEEVAQSPWCSGKVGMAGNSWLAISQYFTAAEQPPHLTCIAPLEGLGDPAREESLRGGIPSTRFSHSIAEIFSGRGQQEDWCAMVRSFTKSNAYLEDKRADMSKIKVPAYIGASYSTDLHTIGSLRAFEQIPHDNKWLILHGTQEWYDIYSQERTQDLTKFFNYYLKGIENGWHETKPVRLALLKYTEPALTNQEFDDLPWHLPSAATQKLYLNADNSLSTEVASASSTLTYQADTSDKLSFKYKFPSKTTLIGPSTLVIHVASSEHDDLDVYTHIFKADADGKILDHLNIPLPDGVSYEEVERLTQNRLFRYWGPSGILRASRRHVSPQLSSKTWQTLSFERSEPVTPLEPIKLEIQLWPTGIVFEAGEQLILEISGERLGAVALPHLAGHDNTNKGKHIVHLGGQSGSHLEFFRI